MIFFNCLRGLLCLIFLSCQILETDARFSNLYSDFKLLFSDTKTWVSEFVSHVDVTVPSFNSLTSLYLKSVNRFMFVADELVTSAYDNFKCAIHNSDDFVTRFTRNTSFWHIWPFKFRYDCCLKCNATAFDHQAKQELYGQHLAIQLVTENLKKHLSDDSPKKPLVMSFHGQTGCGKSFVSKMIADSLFEDGARSEFVHYYHGSLDFPNESRKEAYRKKLLYEVPLFLHNCERSLFIFEEIDKMVPGVLDFLVPYLNFEERRSYLDFRKSTFIFLSNFGGGKIAEITYNAWLDGIQREDITVEDFSSYLEEAAYQTKGGLWQSEIVQGNYIDVFVPFLPLEKKHVKQCIVRELQQRKLPHEEGTVEKVANQLQYDPDFEVFSVSGCKKVSHKIDLCSDNES